ncbi:MAG: hypothetical protein KUG82_10270 [Pseudomonadales bacterium]|nr:hypothetical protein [Pseudomonadales bacterium]
MKRIYFKKHHIYGLSGLLLLVQLLAAVHLPAHVLSTTSSASASSEPDYDIVDQVHACSICIAIDALDNGIVFHTESLCIATPAVYQKQFLTIGKSDQRFPAFQSRAPPSFS